MTKRRRPQVEKQNVHMMPATKDDIHILRNQHNELVTKHNSLAEICDRNARIFVECLHALEVRLLATRRILVDQGIEPLELERATEQAMGEFVLLEALQRFCEAHKEWLNSQAPAQARRTLGGTLRLVGEPEEKEESSDTPYVFGGLESTGGGMSSKSLLLRAGSPSRSTCLNPDHTPPFGSALSSWTR